MAVDRTGNVFAATGDKGVIYKITPAGVGSPLYKTNTTNVVDPGGLHRPAISSPAPESPSRVFKLDAAGKAFVLLD